MELVWLSGIAERYLGRLDRYSQYVNIDLFVQMHIAKEANQSTKIEGTRTNIEEVFLGKDKISLERRDDWEEVQNYIQAMQKGVELLDQLPFSARLIRETHKILLQGVRGEYKLPGTFRKSQNWIGGVSIDDAVFVPPSHTEILDLIADLEKFANNSDDWLPDLIKIAIIHYQFETIHPFLDGNGRVGRLLITLYLVSKGILRRPILYLSDFFERKRSLYYDQLMRVRTHNEMAGWVKFFLNGVIETAQKGVETFEAVLQLQKEMEIAVKDLGARSSNALHVIEYLYQTPVINAKTVGNIIGKTMTPAYRLIEVLEKKGILREITGNERDRIYIFQEYINIFK